jgi:hypothetical protein
VAEQVVSDLRESNRPLVIAGYSALDRLIELITGPRSADGEMRLLLGSEPFPSKRDSFELTPSEFPVEMEVYSLATITRLKIRVSHAAASMDSIP